jgi:hypothetical protein
MHVHTCAKSSNQMIQNRLGRVRTCMWCVLKCVHSLWCALTSVHIYAVSAYKQVQKLQQLVQDPVLLDLLKQMLDYNPETRIPADKVHVRARMRKCVGTRAHTRVRTHAHARARTRTRSQHVCLQAIHTPQSYSPSLSH